MIDRENFSYIKNILSLENDKVDLDSLYEILTALKEENILKMFFSILENASGLKTIKENISLINRAVNDDDQLAFYSLVLEVINPTLKQDLLCKVLKAIKDNPSLEKDLFDSFSNNQMTSKNKLVDVINAINILNNNEVLNKEKEVIIFGSWYGSILIPKLAKQVKQITALDLNEAVLKLAKNRLFDDYDNVEFIAGDVFEKNLKRYHDASLFINTSCEHMLPMNCLPLWDRYDTYFVFQSNNMDYIEDHINCVYSLEEFKSQLPENATVLFEDEIQDTRGTRYMLVGKVRRTI